MFSNTQLERYADVLLWGLKKARTNRYQRNDVILIRFDLAALPLAEILQEKILRLGMHPVVRFTTTSRMEHSFFELASHPQLVFQPPGSKEFCEHLHGSIFLHAPDSLTHLRDVDPKKIGTAAVAAKPLRDILTRREEQGEFGWTLCTFPTQALARHAKMSLNEYTRQIVKACYLHVPHPTREWEKIFKRATAIKKWLNSLQVKTLHVESEHIDLSLTPGERRKWVGISGHNIPSFELFLSPDWRGTEGTYYANLPSFRSGNYVKDVTLTFIKGCAVKVTAEEGEAFTQQQLMMDNGANKVGEFSLTDTRFSKIDTFMANTLYDENYGGRYGNCHVALGNSYSDTYAGNPATLTKERKSKLGFNDSALHWDLINTEQKRVTAHLTNGKRVVIYENGTFNY